MYQFLRNSEEGHDVTVFDILYWMDGGDMPSPNSRVMDNGFMAVQDEILDRDFRNLVATLAVDGESTDGIPPSQKFERKVHDMYLTWKG